MELILWRHAEAEDGFPDIDRALTAKGRKQAEKMAAWLNLRIPDDTRILVSPAKRAQQTATALARDFTTVMDIAPGASAEALLAATDWPNAESAMLVVGHQPTLGAVAAHLLAGQNTSWSVKKGAVWWVSGKIQLNGMHTVLRAVISPEFQ